MFYFAQAFFAFFSKNFVLNHGQHWKTFTLCVSLSHRPAVYALDSAGFLLTLFIIEIYSLTHLLFDSLRIFVVEQGSF